MHEPVCQLRKPALDPPCQICKATLDPPCQLCKANLDPPCQNMLRPPGVVPCLFDVVTTLADQSPTRFRCKAYLAGGLEA